MKRSFQVAGLICTFLLASRAFSQITPGGVTSFEPQQNAVLFHMKTGAIKVQFCTPSIVHIVYSPDGSFPDHADPMIVRTAWPGAHFSVASTDRAVTVSTSDLRVTLRRKNGAVTYADAQGKTLLRGAGDDGGWRMTPATVNGERTYHASTLFFPQSGEAFYGLGQHQAGVWNYAGEDVALSQDNTNISIPFFVSSLGYGVLWNNASVSRFNDRFAQHLFIDAQVADTIDYYLFYGPSLDRIIAGYRSLTGQAPLFGKWTYGYWQSKNRYNSQAEVLSVAQKYRQLGIPADNIVQDWFWWTQMGSFVFNKNYPDPKAMVDTLHREHFHIMISVWPTIIPGSKVFDTFNQNGWFIHKNKPGTSWLPGGGLYDPFNPKVRAAYWNLIDDHLFRLGFDAWWLDTTEPETLFREQSLMLHAHTALGSGARYANLYPLMTTTAVYDGQRRTAPDQRVFILTRSAAAGMQRNAAAAWSGDLFSTWTALKRQIPAGLNYSLSGLPYWTTDIGGFVGASPNDPAYRELFVRWFEYGVFCPIFRVHGTRATNQNELWSYGYEAQTILTRYDNLRYRLMPYIYSTAWRVTHHGYTLMRPLVMDFPSDPEARRIGNQFMFGPSLLVSPVTNPGVDSRRLYLPPAEWYNFWTGSKLSGGRFIDAKSPLQTEPIYVRAGSILPLGPFEQYTGQKPDAPVELRVYPGADGHFTFYEDDGETYAYEKGAYATIPIDWNDATHTLTLGARHGSFPGMNARRRFNIVWVSEGHGSGIRTAQPADKFVQYDGSALSITR